MPAEQESAASASSTATIPRAPTRCCGAAAPIRARGAASCATRASPRWRRRSAPRWCSRRRCPRDSFRWRWRKPPRSPLLAGKDPGLVVLSEQPLTAETPAHLLDDDTTPAARLFVRNNGDPPAAVDASTWTLRIDGEAVERPLELSLAELRSEFENHTLALQLECAGNGRAFYAPSVAGSQWTTGAIALPALHRRAAARRAGARRRQARTRSTSATGAPTARAAARSDEVPISRGVPIAKAMEDETLLAWAIDGEPLPLLHGAPLRLVCPGWPGSASGKWLRRIAVRDRVHDGAKMTGHSYRMPCSPVAPGAEVAEADMCILEAMPVKSLITRPATGVDARRRQAARGLGPRLGRRRQRRGGRRLDRLRPDLAPGGARAAAQSVGLAALARRRRVPAARLLRGLGPGHRHQRPGAADGGAGVESRGLRQQHVPPHRRHGGLIRCRPPRPLRSSSAPSSRPSAPRSARSPRAGSRPRLRTGTSTRSSRKRTVACWRRRVGSGC